jgi:hypothetical protein
MVAKRSYHKLENMEGIGEVFDGDSRIAKVSYRLEVVEESLSETGMGGVIHKGNLFQNLHGSITILEGANDIWRRNTLTLLLEDGTTKFFVVQSSFNLEGKYDIRESKP